MRKENGSGPEIAISSIAMILVYILISLFFSSGVSAVTMGISMKGDYCDIHIDDLKNSSDLSGYELWVLYDDGSGAKRESKYFGVLSETIRFVPVGDGNYTFRLYDVRAQELECESTFILNAKTNGQLFDDAQGTSTADTADTIKDNETHGICDVFEVEGRATLGDAVHITLKGIEDNGYQDPTSSSSSSRVLRMYVTHNDGMDIQTFLLKDITRGIPSFVPRDPGQYTITAVCSDSSEQSKTIIIGDDQTADGSDGSDQEAYADDDNDVSLKMLHVVDSNGDQRLGTMELRGVRKVDISHLSPLAIPVSKAARTLGLDSVSDAIEKAGTSTSQADMADAKIMLDGLEGFERSTIEFNDLVIADTPEIRVEEIASEDRDKIAIGGKDVLSSYAMDLSNLDFTKGSFSKKAQGSQLWKCRDWDYGKRTCLGDWVKIKDIVPGMVYDIDISPVDPGYAETGLVTINTDKGIYHPGETAGIFVAVLDNEGHLVSGAEINLTVSEPSGINHTYSTDASYASSESGDIITEVQKGVYGLRCNHTSQAGEYAVFANVAGDGISMYQNNMSTSFSVMEDFGFEIIRDAPMSFDPLSGDMVSGITVISYAADADHPTFSLEERLPPEFIIIDAGLGTISSDGTFQKITWDGLTSGSHVSYKVRLPPMIPQLWFLGPSRIYYPTYDGEMAFDEYRVWMLAADPVGVSRPTAYTDPSAVATNPTYAYDGSASTYAVIDIDNNPTTRYVTYTSFNISGYDGLSSVSAINITFDVDTTGAFTNDQWGLQYTTNSGASWTTCSSGSTALSRQNVTCAVTFSNWNMSTFSSNFQARISGTRTGSADGVSMNVYEIYASLNYTPPNIIPTPLTSAINESIVYINNSVTFNATWKDMDGTLSHWKFSWNTSSGWTNDTAVSFTSNNVSNVSKEIDYPEGTVIFWRFYANDSNGAWNATPIRNFTVYGQDLIAPTVWWLNVSPSSGVSGTKFNLTANVTDDQVLGSVKAELTYPNGTSVNYSMSSLGNNIFSYIFNSTYGGNFSFVVYASDGTNTNVSGYNRYFNVTPNLTTDRIYYARGDRVTISGRGFSAGKGVELAIRDPFGNLVSGFPRNITANSSGGFVFQWNISSSLSTRLGNYSIVATDNTTSWLTANASVTVVIKPTSSTMVTDDPNAPGGSAGILTMDVFTQINNSDNIYANIVSSTTETYLQTGFSNVMSPGQDVNYAMLYFEHREMSTADIYVNWLNSTTGAYQTICIIPDSATEIFSNCSLSGVIRTSDDVNSLSIRLSDNNLGTNNVNWTIMDFVYIIVNFTASSSMSIDIIEPADSLMTYDYYDVYNKAYGGSTAEPIGARLQGTEATSTQYNNLKMSDGFKYDTQITGAGGVHAYQTFKFIVTDPIPEITGIRFTHEGYATRTTSQSPDPFTIYVWNISSASYSALANVDGTSADVITISSLFGNNSDLINSTNGEIWFLVEGTFSTGGGPNAQADIHTDYAKLDVTRVPIMSGMEDINATVVDADGVNSCNYFYRYPNNTYAGPSYPMQSQGSNVYFNISDTSMYIDGFYYLYVNCTDSLNTRTNASKYVKILNSAPYVNLTYPLNGSNITYRNINFSWYLSGSSQGIGMCNLTIDSSRVAVGVLSQINQNTTYNYTVLDGVHYWNVSCVDSSGLFNVSPTWYIDVDSSAPIIVMNYPSAGRWVNTDNITFNYTPNDAHELLNCSLYVDGAFNQYNASINRSNPNFFSVYGLGQGIHNWSVNCTDSFRLSNRTAERNFTVDTAMPNITLYYPPSESSFTGGNITINFSVKDNLDASLSCNLTIDDVVSEVYRNYAVSNNSNVSITEYNVADGMHYWNLSCWDDAYNVNYTQTRNFTMVGPPRIIINYPENRTWFNRSNVSFSYYVFDGNGIGNCSIYFDGVLNQSNTTAVNNDGNNTFDIMGMTEGMHSWFIRCYDTVGSISQSFTRNLFVDLTRPQVSVYLPDHAASFTNTTITFNYSVTDNMDQTLVCNLTMDGMTSTANRNMNSTNGTMYNITQFNVTDGGHIWSITCVDDAGNYNTSEYRNFSIDTVPNVILIDPLNSAKRKNNVTFIYNASDMSGIGSCSLLIDGEVNQTLYSPDVVSGANGTFNVTDLVEGLHTWTVNCSDMFGLSSQPAHRNLTIDMTAPMVYAYSPNATRILGSTVTFNFTATDAATSILNCTIYVDTNFWINTTTAQSGVLKSLNITEITDGLHYWNVSCTDEANNTRYSSTLNFTVDTLPTVTLDQPYNNTADKDGDVVFTYYVAEANLTNCSLILNDSIYMTKNVANITYISNDGLNNFTVAGLSEGNYSWNVMCFDVAGSNGTGNARTFYIDKAAPYNITLHEPMPNSTIYVSTINFNWTVNDSISPQLYCNISINGIVNKTNITAYSGIPVNTSISGFGVGDYNWSVTCYDLAGWNITSEKRNFTVSGMVRVTLIGPDPNYLDGDGNVTFFYKPESLNDFNTIGTCELYLDGVSNKTGVRPTNGGINNLSINDIDQGWHTWYMNCSDNVGTYGTSENRSLLVDLFDPTVNATYPKGNSLPYSYVNFNFTASDNIATYLICNITVDGNIVATNINATNGSSANKTVYGFSDGLHFWNVTCADFGNRLGTSALQNFTISEPPIVRLANPADRYRTNMLNITFYYNVSDNSNNVSSCTLILNGIANNTNTNVNISRTNNVTVNDLTEGTYTWDINCSDASGNSAVNGTPRTFYIDLTPPKINLSYPQYAQTFNTNNITFNWTAVDFDENVSINCSLSVSDPSGDRFVALITGYSNKTFNYTLTNFSDGSHYWNVTCNDNLNNTNTSETWYFIINQPDLYINDSLVRVNNVNPDINSTINITANVSNTGGITANNVLVEFWDGDPSSGIFIGNATGNVVQNSSTLFSVLWNITEGYHNINVRVDPYEMIGELNDTNNNATYNISVLRSIINSPENQSTSKMQNISFNFTLIDYTSGILSGLINYSIYVDNILNGQAGTVSDNVSALVNITFSEGLHNVKIEARDYLGRRKNSTAVYVTVDYTAPNSSILTQNNSWYNNSAPMINITSKDNVDSNINYTIYVNGTINAVGNITNGTSYLVDLSIAQEGYYEIIMEGTDDFNNTANSTPKFIYVDWTRPDISLAGPIDGSNFTTRSVTLNYTASDNLAFNLSCNLTLDGSSVASQILSNGNYSTYTASNLAEGTHYWNVTCIDQSFNRNTSAISSFNVYIPPAVVLISPASDNWSRYSDNTFYFNVSDETGLENCSILFYDAVNQTKTAVELINNATNNFTVSGMSGIYNWSIICYDNTTYRSYNSTQNRTIYVDLLAPFANITTQNNSWFNVANPLISFNITDNMDNVLDYVIYVNGSQNVSGSVTNGALNSVNLIGVADGIYSVIVESYDSAGNFENSTPITIYVDSVRPSVNLTLPLNDTNVTVTTLDLNFTVSDNMAGYLLCNLTLDGNIIGGQLNITNGAGGNVTVSSLIGGYHNWNVTCADQAANRNTSSTFRFYVVMPDVFVNSTMIYFSNEYPVENDSVNITATIANIGLATAQNFTVEIRLNNITGTLIHSENISLEINGTLNISTLYNMPIGDTLFFVLIDTPLATNGTLRESNESNNNASRMLHVGLWEYIVGNTYDRLVMTDVVNQTIYDWLVGNSSGSKLFAADIDSNINWRSLQALGLNMSNQSSSQDFTALDGALGSTNFADSVNRTYTSANIPLEIANYTIFTRKVMSVPIVNSTNNSNFKTGILWDYSDGGTRYQGTQDILFVSPINKNAPGYNATVDYELRIPATLRSYKSGEDKVVFYAEIN